MNRFFIIGFIVCAITCSAQNKIHLPKEEYYKWHRIAGISISPKGEAFGYGKFSDTIDDTLFVGYLKNLAIKRKIINGTKFNFLNEELFIYLDGNKNAHIEDLNSDFHRIYEKIRSYEPVLNNRFILLYSGHFSNSSPGLLKIVDTRDFSLNTYEDVTALSISNNQAQLGITQKGNNSSHLFLLDLVTGNKHTVGNYKNAYPVNLSWNRNDTRLAFILSAQNEDSLNRVGYVDITLKGSELNPVFLDRYFEDYDILSDSSGELSFSPNNSGIFFWLRRRTAGIFKENVEVWNSHDKYSYPIKISRKPGRKLAIWNLETDIVQKITRDEESSTYLSPNKKYVITTINDCYLPNYKFGGNYSDIYISEVGGKRKYKLLEKYPEGLNRSIIFSPSGKSLVFLYQGKWWFYDIELNKRTPIGNIEMKPFHFSEYPDVPRLYDSVFWSADDNHILVADEYDIWLLNTDGSGSRKLTEGRKDGIHFRFLTNTFQSSRYHLPYPIKLDDGVYFEARNKDTDDRGYYYWNISTGLKEIIFGPKHFSEFNPIPGKRGYLYIREDFNSSPELVFQPNNRKKIKIIDRSNSQQDKYYWGRSEMLYYRSFSNQPLRAAMFYPAGYKKGKEYPLIINIYEDNSDELNKYFYPNLFNAGLNTAFYTLNGYFVIQPQITYQRGSPGVSAYEDVDALLNHIQEMEVIDRDRIGLYGHSFGGYEATFIATQSNQFATIIAGAPITDLVSYYFNYSPLMTAPDFMRTEFQQHIMNKDFFSIQEQYLANSPLHLADHVDVPILLWHGKEDTNISYTQSLEFYFALKRLDKISSLLIYKNEGHVPVKSKNLWDLNYRMLDWFDHYLKGKPKATWMN